MFPLKRHLQKKVVPEEEEPAEEVAPPEDPEAVAPPAAMVETLTDKVERFRREKHEHREAANAKAKEERKADRKRKKVLEKACTLSPADIMEGFCLKEQNLEKR